MNANTKKTGLVIVASAIIWGVIIFGCASALKGTECYAEIQNFLLGGAVGHLLLVWAPLGIAGKRKSKDHKRYI